MDDANRCRCGYNNALRDSTEGGVCSRFELVVEVSISSLSSGLVNIQWSIQWRNSGVKLQWIELGTERVNGKGKVLEVQTSLETHLPSRRPLYTYVSCAA